MIDLDAQALTPIYHALRANVIQGAIAIDPRPPVRVLVNGRWNVWVVVDAAFDWLQESKNLGLNTADLPTQWHVENGKRTSTTIARMIAERAGMSVEGKRVSYADGDKRNCRLSNLCLERGRITRHRTPHARQR